VSLDPATLAPHVDPDWTEALVLELRLRDVPGDVIGDVLTEIETHVLDSGTSAQDAFGDATRYAEQVAETAARPTPDDPRDMVPYALGAAGFVAALNGLGSWVKSGTLTLTVGILAVVVVVAVTPFVLQRYGTPLLRFLVTGSPLRASLVVMAPMVPTVVLVLLGRAWEVAALPAAPVTLGGAAVALAAVVMARRRPTAEDPVVAPGGDREAALAAARRETGRLTLVTTGVQVTIAVLAVVGVVLLSR
jgi:uncharacterized membrane protein